MKILYYFAYDGSFMTEWQRIQIFDELSRHNVLFEVFNPNSFNSLEECNEKLLERLREDSSIDAFLNCLGDKYFLRGTIEQLSKISIPKILICFDNLHAPYMHRQTAPFFDLVWLTSWETESMFRNWGCNTIFLPYASNPYAFQDLYSTSVDKVCFIGTPYGTRAITFNKLITFGVDVDVFCKSSQGSVVQDEKETTLTPNSKSRLRIITELLSFPIGRKVVFSGVKSKLIKQERLLESEHLRLLEKVSYKDMNKAYANYALSLNITTLRNTAILNSPVLKLHLRTFEIPMAYGLELTEYNEELMNYFNKNEVITYKSDEELVEKALYYTNPKHAEEVRKLKLLARKRAENEHTWYCRFRRVFDELNLSK